jgi:N-formylglutamate deformylase
MDTIDPASSFRYHPPRANPAPVVFDSPHSGTNYPADFGSVAPLAVLRRSEDAFVDELFGSAPGHGAPLIAAEFPRIYIDPNRALVDLDPAMLDGPWPDPLVPSRKTELGVGLIWRIMPPDAPLYDRLLAVEEVRGRIERCWKPYHQAVAGAIDETHRRFGRVWHVNCHSMPAVGNAASEDGPVARAVPAVAQLAQLHEHGLRVGLLGQIGKTSRAAARSPRALQPEEGVDLLLQRRAS